MLSVVSPGKFILTLQSIPPFFVEGILVLILAVLLAVPLIVHVQYLLGNPFEVNMKTIPPFDHWCEPERSSHVSRVVMHYPAPKFPESTSSLSLSLDVETARKTFSTPILQKNDDTMDSPNRRTRKTRESHKDSLEAKNLHSSKNLHLERSSSFVVTNSEVPIIDISSFNYNAYRHKLIEAILRKRYDDYQPPGNVILNSIHLNTTDSIVDLALNSRYDHSFCDFIEGNHDPTQRLSRKEMEYLHPLDHFSVKGIQKPQTTEKSVETEIIVEEDVDVEDYDEMRDKLLLPPINLQNFRKHSNIDWSANVSNVTVKLPSSRAPSVESSKLVRKTGSNISRVTNSQEKSHKSLRNPSVSLSDRKRSTKPSSMRSSVDSLNSVTSKKPLRETAAFNTLFSSSENESIYSDSSRMLVESSPRSWDELSSKSRSSTPRKLQPCTAGTPINVSDKSRSGVSKGNSDTFGKKSSVPSNPTPRSKNETFCRPRSANLPLLSRRSKVRKVNGDDKSTLENSKNLLDRVDKSMTKIQSKFQSSRDRTILNEANGSKTNEISGKIQQPSSTFSISRNIRVDYLSPRPKTVSAVASKVPVATSSLQSRNRLKVLANSAPKPMVVEDEQSKDVDVTNAKSSGNFEDDTLKTVEKALSSKDQHEQCLRTKVDRKSEDTITLSRSSRCSSRMISSVERRGKSEKRKMRNKESKDATNVNEKIFQRDVKLPQRGTKVNLAMQNGLKNYMQKLKEVTENRSEKDITRLVSLSLTEAILPGLQSALSANELQELKDLLNRAEIKSEREEGKKSQSSLLNMTR